MVLASGKRETGKGQKPEKSRSYGLEPICLCLLVQLLSKIFGIALIIELASSLHEAMKQLMQ